MATQHHNLSRRQTLEGIGLAGAVTLAPHAGAAATQPNRSAWNAALVNYNRVAADADRAHERWNRAAETYKELAGRDPWSRDHAYDNEVARLSGFHQLNHNIDDWGDRVADAASTLIEMPAPDQEALLWKVEYLWADDPTAGYSEERMQVVLADFRRLLTNGRA